MATRHRDKELLARLDSVIVRRRADIMRVLEDYSVPMLQKQP
jgi:hypothetical protein